jgi:hypothetical protein
MHTDTSFHPGANAIIAEAIARHVPVVSARQMLKWLDGRNGSSFGPLTWNNNQLAFTITALPDALNLQGMLPFYAEYGQLVSLTRDGSPVAFTKQTIKGIEYAFFNVPVGTASWLASYSSSPSAPFVQAVLLYSPAKRLVTHHQAYNGRRATMVPIGLRYLALPTIHFLLWPQLLITTRDSTVQYGPMQMDQRILTLHC